MPFQFNPPIIPSSKAGRGSENILQALLARNQNALGLEEIAARKNIASKELNQRQAESRVQESIARDELETKREIANRSSQIDFIRSALSEGYDLNEINSMISGEAPGVGQADLGVQEFLKGNIDTNQLLAGLSPSQMKRYGPMLQMALAADDAVQTREIRKADLEARRDDQKMRAKELEFKDRQLQMLEEEQSGGITPKEARTVISRAMLKDDSVPDASVISAAKTLKEQGKELSQGETDLVRNAQLNLHTDISGKINKFGSVTKDFPMEQTLAEARKLIDDSKLAGYDSSGFENEITSRYLKLPDNDFSQQFNRIEQIQNFKSNLGSKVPIPELVYPDKNDPTYAKIKGFYYGTKEEADKIMSEYKKAYEAKQKYYERIR